MDQNNKQHIDELLAKWLAGEATQAEIDSLQEFSDQTEENAQYVQQFEKIWNHASDAGEAQNIDTAWALMQNKMQVKPASNLKVVYRIAAALAACLGLFIAGKWFYNQSSNPVKQPSLASSGLFIQAGNSPFTTTLSDGTTVILQAHATLTADSSFGKNNRILNLTGDAYFKTVHGKKHIFTVRTKNSEVRDIGTAFWVYAKAEETQVAVTEGSVQVFAFKDSVMLVKGDSAFVSGMEKKLQKIAEKTTEKANEIKDKTLVFFKTELRKVTKLLNETYHSDIRLANDKISNCKFSASFKNEDLETVLEIIRETFNLEIRREGNIIYLEGEGCQ